MRAGVLTEYGEPLELRDRPEPEPKLEPEPEPDGVVVRTEARGICPSDWHARQGEWDWPRARAPLGVSVVDEFGVH